MAGGETHEGTPSRVDPEAESVRPLSAMVRPRRGDIVRGCDVRDYPAEVAASERYEELRLLPDPDLADLAGWKGPRQQMIATILAQ